MTYRVKRVSKRRIANEMAFLGGATQLEQPVPVKRGPQPEGEVNKEVARWRSLQPGLVLERNKRRLAVPVGYDKPIMLGWLQPGSPDWIGYLPVTITQEHVGRTVAVFVGIESKRRSGGVVSGEQEAFLNNARDAGAIVGVARSFEDCGLIVERWRAKR